MNSLESRLYSLIGQAPNQWDLNALVLCVGMDELQVRTCLKALEDRGEVRSEPGGYRIVPNDERPAHQRRPDNITIDDLTFDEEGNPVWPVLTRSLPIPRKGLLLTPGQLGDHGYRSVCELTGVEPAPQGYGALLVEYESSGSHGTLFTRDVAWVETIAQVLEHSDVGQSPRLDVNPQVLGEKIVAAFDGWPDQWGQRRPAGGVTPAY